MKITDRLKSAAVSLYMSLKRFPIAIGLSAAAAVLLMVLMHGERSFSKDMSEMLGRIAMTLALGIPVSLCTRLIFERKTGIRPVARVLIYLVEAFVLVLYYFFLLKDFSMVTVTRYIALSLSFYLGFIFIPYFYGREGFELYVIRLLTRFFTTVIYSVVLYLGTAAILFTIDKLLEIKVDQKVYFDVWLAVVGMFAPGFFLAGTPLYGEQLETNSYPKLLKVLVLYIIMPILAVYTAILYVYFAKIIVTLQWPIGMVAHLVLWYSVICTFVVFFISPLSEENKWTRSFIFLLPKVIIPLLLMMFVSVGIRINAYGVTENRYFVILLGLWVMGMMLLFNFVKNRRNIILPVTLSLIAFLSVVGPWSSYSVSMYSQNHRLEGILMKNDMLKGGSIVKADKEVPAADKKEISQILSYFSQYHSLNDVRHLPKGFKIEQMNDVFGFSNIGQIDYNDEFISYASNAYNKAVDIKGYDYFFQANSYSSANVSSGYGFDITYDNKIHEITISRNGKELYKRSLLDYVKQVHDKYGSTGRGEMDSEKLSFTDENQNIKVKFVFNHIDLRENTDGKGISQVSVDFYLLVSPK